jgi:hypothetical protein
MIINEVAGEIRIIDVVADAIYNFIISSEIELDGEGKILDELFRRTAKQYGLRWRGTTLRDLHAKLAVIKRLERKLRLGNPEVIQKRADTRQKNKIAKAAQAAEQAKLQAERDAAWFKQEYSKIIAPRGSGQVKSLE